MARPRASNGSTDFNQQRLRSWKPDLEAKTVFFTFLGIGFCFIPVGLGLLMASNSVQEVVLDYTYCLRVPQRDDLSPPTSFLNCAGYVANNQKPSRCVCMIDFELVNGLQGNVVIYYALSGFYQNHRHFLNSKDESQLLGYVGISGSGCKHFAFVNETMIVPCGSFANSMFNDTLQYLIAENLPVPVPLLRTGLAWPMEKSLFRNPEGFMLNESYGNYEKPPGWSKHIWELDQEIPFNNGMENEDFIIWMRPAAFPNFRKTFRRLDQSVEAFKDGLPTGNYTFVIEYNFPVTSFGGRKFLVVSNASAFGGKNPFLGIAYIATGCCLIVTAIVLYIIHMACGVREEEAIDVRKQDQFFW